MQFLAGFISLTLVVFSQASITIVPGISYKGNSKFHGNTIELRDRYLPHDGFKSFVDVVRELPGGRLVKFYLYTHNAPEPGLAYVRLQIWRPRDPATRKLQLIWEKRLQVEYGSSTGYLYTVTLTEEEQTTVLEGDKIGWTNEGPVGPISYDYVGGHIVYSRLVSEGIYPRINDEYAFAPVPFPAMFSVGVELDQGSQSGVFYGNSLTPKSQYMTTGAQRSFMDADTVLPDGRLVEYLMYIHGIPTSGTTSIKAQIWRPTSGRTYRLVWEKSVVLNYQAIGYLKKISVEENEPFETRSGDRIGWTNSGEVGPISYQLMEGRRTYFREVQGFSYPMVGSDYTFSDMHLPHVYAVGVNIRTENIKNPEEVPDGSSFYGNDLIRRNKYYPADAKRSFIDFNQVLPDGVLTRYSFYVHSIYGTSSTRMRLQIWRPVHVENEQYRLVWEKRIIVQYGSNNGYIRQVPLTESERPVTRQGDRIGWTNESPVGVISSQYAPRGKTYFRPVNDYSYPKMSETCKFNYTYIMEYFSVGVYIAKGTPSTGETKAGEYQYGNAVKQREYHELEDAKKSYIDLNTALPSGKLRSYSLFIHAVTGQTSARLRIQIWRPAQTHTYRLVWQKHVTVYIRDNQGYSHRVNLTESEQFTVQSGDRIGWTNEEDFGVISYSYNRTAATIWRRVTGADFPALEYDYMFNEFPLQYQFSVSVEVRPATSPSVPGPATEDSSRPSMEPKTFGNSINPRENYLSEGGRKTFIDMEADLPNGILTKFMFYVHKIPVSGEAIIRLQIWRPENEDSKSFRLVWEYRKLVYYERNIGFQETVTLEDSQQFNTKTGDRLGWTNEADIGIISYQVKEGHRVYVKEVVSQNYPSPGHVYTFTTLEPQQQFSVAVEIQEPTGCDPGYWGRNCSMICAIGCRVASGLGCERLTGACQCNEGWYGETCNKRCSSCCTVPQRCHPETGYCTCQEGYSGLTCDQNCNKAAYPRHCSPGCQDISGCDVMTGSCVCKNGWYGPTCSAQCPSTCAYTCNKETGQCPSGTGGAQEGYSRTYYNNVIAGLSGALAITGLILIIIAVVAVICAMRRPPPNSSKSNTAFIIPDENSG